LEHKKPNNTNDGNPQQKWVLSPGSKRVGHDGGCQTEDEDDTISNRGEDAAPSGTFLPTVEPKSLLNEAHGPSFSSLFFTPFAFIGL